MEYFRKSLAVSSFLVVGILAFGWLVLQLGEVFWLTEGETYVLNAEFYNTGGINVGADVQVSGVSVGKVQHVYLNEDMVAVVRILLNREIKIPVDSVALVKSQGIIGDKFIQITLGGDNRLYKPGETIVDTESAVDLESRISEIVFGRMGE